MDSHCDEIKAALQNNDPAQAQEVLEKQKNPNDPNIKIWDLPGVGTTTFTADKYLEHVGFEKFDFFIIVSSDRFRENDAKLAQEIQKMKKKFYFVRSKIDHNIKDEKRSQREFDEENTLKRIRDNCTEGKCFC